MERNKKREKRKPDKIGQQVKWNEENITYKKINKTNPE